MAAYFVLTQQVDDVERYVGEYIPQVMPFLGKHGAEILAASFEANGVEGEPPNGVVVLRFPSEEAGHAFVNDPDYGPAKALRHSITRNFNAVIVPEFTMPDS